jgi:hypothetical protein
MEHNLRLQLHDGDMPDYLRLKEEWTPFTLELVAWDAYGTAFRLLSNNQRVAVSKACHNLWHTGVKHQQYYHEIRPSECPMIKQNIGDTYLHAHRYMRRYTELTHGHNCEIPSNVGRYRMTFGRMWKKGCSLKLLHQIKQTIEPSRSHHSQQLRTEKETH